MEKKILIITDRYYPSSDANSVCAKAVVDAIYSMYAQVQVHILCLDEGEKKRPLAAEEGSAFGKECVHRIACAKRRGGERRKGLDRLFYCIKRTCILPLWPVIWPTIERKLLRAAKRLHRQYMFDTVVAVQHPKETVSAACKLKKAYPSLRFVLYCLDPFSNSYQVPYARYLLGKTKKWEHRMFAAADRILILEGHEDYYTQQEYAQYREKLAFVGVPLLLLQERADAAQKQENILLYGGMFYTGLREPNSMLEVCEIVCREMPEYKMEIYTKGVYYESLAQSRLAHEGIACIKPPVPPDVFYEMMMRSSLLLSVGNAQSDMLPSKTLSYISSGRMIVHFYSNEKDRALPLLRKYPLALLLNQSEPREDNAQKMIAFMQQHEGESVEAATLLAYFSFNLPEHTAREWVGEGRIR